jgi:hypothetical protein
MCLHLFYSTLNPMNRQSIAHDVVRATASATRHNQPFHKESATSHFNDASQLGMALDFTSSAILSHSGEDAR